MSQSYKTLYRSRNNRMIGGVCGGLGAYLGIDPTVVRLLFAFIAILGWVAPAVIVYLVMLFVIPEEPLVTVTSPPTEPATAEEQTSEAPTPDAS